MLYEGKPADRRCGAQLARIGIAYVPEDRRIFRLLTVTENLRTGLDRAGMTQARRRELLDKVYAIFPMLAERRSQAGGTFPAASSRCWRSPAP